MRSGVLLLSMSLLLCAALPAHGDERAAAALREVLAVLDERFIDPARVEAVFSAERRRALAGQADALDLVRFAPILDAELGRLGYSHTRFLADGGFTQRFYESLFATADPDRPMTWHLRASLEPLAGTGHRVVDVGQGGPAERAGLRRGDVIVPSGARSLAAALASGEGFAVDVIRGEARLRRRLVPEFSNPHRAFIEATRASVRVIEAGAQRVGYLRLWTGTHEEVLAILDAAIAEDFARVDAMVLDLRGGFGGAWYPHLDPFFADREGYYRATQRDRDGEVDFGPPGPRRPSPRFDGPLVVLIDEGTRSGKEAVAFQFSRSGRATLVGARTAGAFTAGLGTVGEGWFLYCAVAEPFLDGERLEGRGVEPQLEVPWPAEAGGDDPQLAAALEHLARTVPGAAAGQVDAASSSRPANRSRTDER